MEFNPVTHDSSLHMIHCHRFQPNHPICTTCSFFLLFFTSRSSRQCCVTNWPWATYSWFVISFILVVPPSSLVIFFVLVVPPGLLICTLPHLYLTTKFTSSSTMFLSTKSLTQWCHHSRQKSMALCAIHHGFNHTPVYFFSGAEQDFHWQGSVYWPEEICPSMCDISLETWS